MSREPVTIVEIDVDRCSRRFGVGGCTAALGSGVVRKCFNTIATCPVETLYLPEVKTLRFAEPRPAMPVGQVYFPAVEAVSMFSASVNLAGSDARLSALGRRATVSVQLRDFTYHDRGFDYYQSERVSGAAQTDEGGYDPAGRGSFFGKLKARWPYYTGRPLRVVTGYLDAGVLTDARVRNFVISDMRGPDLDGRVMIEANDILDLAGNDRALAPAPSKGYLAADILDVDLAATLTPVGIGAEYAASGRLVIGSEMVSFTRVGDVLTFTNRGMGETDPASHSAGDTVQAVLRFPGERVDVVLQKLLADYAGVPLAFLPLAKWAAEVDRWLADLRLTTDICKPTGVAELVGELADLGLSVWWDDVAQEVGLKANRPPDLDTVFAVSDDANIITLAPVDQNEDRLTEIYFHTVQIDPTGGVTSSENFRRVIVAVDLEAKEAIRHGDTRVRRIYSRWFNEGADQIVSILAYRLLKRFSAAPVLAKIKLDAKDLAIGLTDVLQVTSRAFQDGTGKSEMRPVQVIAKSEPRLGHDLELTVQAYPFTSRAGFLTDNARPTYTGSSAAQRARGCYLAGPSLRFPADNSKCFRMI